MIAQDGKAQALYLVVETKGYDSSADMGEKESWKIASARQFFAALQAEHVPVKFATKINQQQLSALLAEMDMVAN